MGDRIFELYEGKIGAPAVIDEARTRIAWLVDRVACGSVLDVGCSQGLLPVLLARKGFDVTGIDIDAESIAAARNYVEKEAASVQGRIRLEVADITEMNVGTTPYATIILALLFDAPEPAHALLDAVVRHAAADAHVLAQVNFGQRSADAPRGFMPSELLRIVEKHFVVDDIEVSGQRICLSGHRDSNRSEAYARDAVLVSRLEYAIREKEAQLLEELSRYQGWVKQLKQLKQEKEQLLSEDQKIGSEPNWRKLAVERRRVLARSRRTIESLKAELEACENKLEAKQETILRLQERLAEQRAQTGKDADHE